MSILPYMDQTFAALSVSIETSQETYHYGDNLSMTIIVSEITGDIATVYIIDTEERKSILLSPPIIQETTEFPSRFPFDATIWKTGTYTLEVEYSGAKSSVQFSIEDTGEIALPFWIKDLAKMWITEPLVTDKDFARAIEYLIQKEIIKIPYTEPKGEAVSSIPDWVKTNAEWWIDEKISDTEFTLSLQYLVQKGIITVNLPKV
ncbi:MAG TPA: hypothetical protein EYO93_01415 [Nitrososphaerales archaeon]|nr:hypothetical protein [Nitrososphaerales archaeon]